MDLTKLLLDQLGSGGLDAVASKIGADKQKTASALEGIIPTLLGGLSNNAQTEEGAEGLLGALDNDEHDGSILDNLGGLLGGDGESKGAGILKHVLGNNQPAVEQGLSAKTGLDTSQIGSLLKMAAPLLMGYLGKQKRSQSSSGFDISSISGLLGGMTKDADAGTGLDLGDILSVVGGLTGGSSKGGGIGGMLGKLFGK